MVCIVNETFARYGGARYTDWRLFQLAFILAHVPTLASRMPEFEDRFDAFRDELSASLLYFPTGGGKSEAFFGLLIFNMFLDRLRGKHRGVTALVRYPLRLLTLQQARRLMRVLVQAELVRTWNQAQPRTGISVPVHRRETTSTLDMGGVNQLATPRPAQPALAHSPEEQPGTCMMRVTDTLSCSAGTWITRHSNCVLRYIFSCVRPSPFLVGGASIETG